MSFKDAEPEDACATATEPLPQTYARELRNLFASVKHLDELAIALFLVNADPVVAQLLLDAAAGHQAGGIDPGHGSMERESRCLRA
jgi:hypothetical protein